MEEENKDCFLSFLCLHLVFLCVCVLNSLLSNESKACKIDYRQNLQYALISNLAHSDSSLGLYANIADGKTDFTAK